MNSAYFLLLFSFSFLIVLGIFIFEFIDLYLLNDEINPSVATRQQQER